MAVLAWVVGPAVAGHGASKDRFFVTLLCALTLGLLWQAILVVILLLRERRVDPSWTNVRDRLWLRAPHTATRRGGRLWLWVLVFALALAALDMAPFGPIPPDDRSFGVFLESDAGQALFHHDWWLYALCAFELALNTVVGEELFFRGLLLPRMGGAFGRADSVVNGVLFGLYQGVSPEPSAAESRSLARLTERERQVLSLVADGRSNQEIADLLVIAESTAKTHVKRLLAKIDARDRAQAVVFASAAGWSPRAAAAEVRTATSSS